MNKLLIVIDMQNDFVSGSLGTEEAKKIVPNVVNLVKKYSESDVIYTRDTHGKDYLDTDEGRHLPIKHCIEGTPGWCIIDELQDYTYKILNKYKFGYGNWEKYIYGLPRVPHEITLVGLVTDICVITNAVLLKTLLSDIRIKVDASCCAGTTPEKHKAALEVMKSCQIEVINE